MNLNITYKNGKTSTVTADLASLVAAEDAGWTQDRINDKPLSFAAFMAHTLTPTNLNFDEWLGTVEGITPTEETVDPTVPEG